MFWYFQVFKHTAYWHNHTRPRENRDFSLKRRKLVWQNLKNQKISFPVTTKPHPLRLKFKPSLRYPLKHPNTLNTNEPVRVFELKEEQNIDKQTTPIETRDLFEHENDYKEYLEKLKINLETKKSFQENEEILRLLIRKKLLENIIPSHQLSVSLGNKSF